jgi:hypothetical protein
MRALTAYGATPAASLPQLRSREPLSLDHPLATQPDARESHARHGDDRRRRVLRDGHLTIRETRVHAELGDAGGTVEARLAERQPTMGRHRPPARGPHEFITRPARNAYPLRRSVG